jgi:D-alanine-D-alanine ligase
MTKHIAVLMGGWSAEREVSLRSGKACADAAERQGFRVSRIDVTRDIASVLRELQPDAALNLLHGRPGEDGSIQGLLEVLGIPYTHSGVLSSALAMQKDLAKVVLKAAGVPVPEGLVVSRLEAAKQHVLPPPYVIKPIAEGSSVGVFIVTPEHRHPPQELNRDDWSFGERVLCESYIAGKELTCAVMGDEALGVIEIVSAVQFYDYEAKYAPGGSKHLLPASLSPFVYQEVRRLALAAHRALGCCLHRRTDRAPPACLSRHSPPRTTVAEPAPRRTAAAIATAFPVLAVAVHGPTIAALRRRQPLGFAHHCRRRLRHCFGRSLAAGHRRPQGRARCGRQHVRFSRRGGGDFRPAARQP